MILSGEEKVPEITHTLLRFSGASDFTAFKLKQVTSISSPSAKLSEANWLLSVVSRVLFRHENYKKGSADFPKCHTFSSLPLNLLKQKLFRESYC